MPREFDDGGFDVAPKDDPAKPLRPVYDFLGVQFFNNPRSFITAEIRLAVAGYASSRGGYGEMQHLPFGGGVFDQPALLMDAWAVIAGTWGEVIKAKG